MRVFGISLDSVEDQGKFHEQQELNFPLLSDTDGSAAQKYDVLAEGRRYASRVTFVIDDKGILRAIDSKVDVSSHGEDVVALVESLRQ